MPPAKILVVEDENIVARDICARLEQFGYDVAPPVATGEEAIARARGSRPDLVLMDIMLRGPMDGIEAARVIREQLNVPVVYLTAYVDEKNLQRAKVTEPFGYLLKPFEERELQITIEMALYKHSMEQQLRETNAFNELLVHTIPFGMDIVDNEGRILFMSDNMKKLFPGTGAADRCWDVYREDKTQCDGCPLRSPRDLGSLVGIEVAGIAGGRTFSITHTQMTYLGRPAVLEVFQDITEKKKTERDLRQSEDRFAKALRTSPDAVGISRIDDGTLIEVNQGYTELTGYPREEMIGRSALALGLWADPAQRERLVKELRSHGEVRNFEVSLRTKRGETRSGLASARPIDIDGEPCMITVVRDITDRLLLELQLTQAQKMEGIGTLASSIAHDFNNILNNILGFTMQLRKHAADIAKVERYSQTIEKSAVRGAELSAQLLSFARKARRETAPVDIAELIDEMAALCVETFPPAIAVRKIVAGGLPRVLGDRSELYQVLLNLCVNARDSMGGPGPDGGHVLTIEAVMGNASGTVSPELLPERGERSIELRVTDTGTGIPKDIRERIFEPFFTTKERGKGTGLGLSVAYNVVRNHKGTILVESEEGKGSAFRVFLPPVPGEGPGGDGKASRKKSSEGVLIVDDEVVMLDLARELLEEQGYTVFTAPNGQEALEIYRSNREKIDVVVLDLVMPGMDGGQLFLELKKMNPQVKAFFCTGYMSDRVITDLLAEEDLKAIQKPVRPDVLIKTIRDILDEIPA
ncbi:MAG TPA: response regulator [Bacteroidota bacterium]|nr:response regulator [Bacteroidota bacterium]